MKEYTLKVAQSGFAAGRAFCFNRKTGGESPADEILSKESEIVRFDTAVDTLERELSETSAKAGQDTAEIFEMERMLLKDERFIKPVRDLILNQEMSAAEAVRRAGDALAEEFRSSDSEYISQRSEDVLGIIKRLQDLFRGEKVHVLQEPSIIVSVELSPAELSSLDTRYILGIVTEKGAPTSHVAILAGNLGIPYYYGSADAVASISEGSRLILEDGKLTADPEEEVFQAAISRMKEEWERKHREQRGKCANGSAGGALTRTKIYANIAGPQDIDALMASGADGVGLFRSEFLFLDHKGAPSEEEQFQAYRSVIEAMAGRETVIRTMDLGSDKKADWLNMPEEKNPALGCRGLRLSLQEGKLFRIQLRALLRAASCGDLKVMVPMVASPWEIDAVRCEMDSCAKELEKEGKEYRVPPLGIMVETPAAALISDQLAEKVDFFSIGTNDLTQYTLALDREAQGLDQYYDPCHDAVLQLIGMTAAAGHKRNIPTAVCGELAGNPEAIPKLIERGVDELSVSVSKVEATRKRASEAEGQPLENKEPVPEEKPLAAPADGELVPMEDIPDPVFSAGTLGECVGILPENGTIYAPCDGIVSGIAETNHAITFTDNDGRKILLHVGIDTVTLGGRGFTVLAKAGDNVAKGDVVMEADLDVIRKAGLSPMVITVCCR